MQGRHLAPWAMGFALATTSLYATASFGAGGYLVRDSWYAGRTIRPKLQFNPTASSAQGLKGQELVEAFLAQEAATYGYRADLADLELARVQKSLVGLHFHYYQKIDDAKIEGAGISVTLDLSGDKVTMVYSTIRADADQTDRPAARPMGVERAFDVAWQALGVQGRLLAKPTAELVYRDVASELRLVYKVFLQVSEPYGAWMTYVDAATGAVVARESATLSRMKRGMPGPEPLADGPTRDRQTAFAEFFAQSTTDSTDARDERADGEGRVFDPDPRTTLADPSLSDRSSAASFDAAYVTRTLNEISFDGEAYRLDGPWVKIIDFDPPTRAPSTTDDGVWDTPRGQNAFNDAMTYFHIDQNQRYMQSLGFTGETGIQFGPIEVDTDGVYGGDNSYFQPSTNRLSFGHGCVDDNEDSDVILHEYGHAIQHSINPDWFGGDTGAMGEGFGDYWAGSYSVSTEAGRAYHPNEVFSWDGHGDSNECWPGRRMDVMAVRYDHARSYQAHSRTPDGFTSDELWSTPLFQALQELMAMGVERADVDRVILQAHFGLGSGVKMRDMANAIIRTAEVLSPGPQAEVFAAKFRQHGIIAD